MLIFIAASDAYSGGADGITYRDVLDAQLLTLKGGRYDTVDLLYKIDEESNHPEVELVALLDYYVGSGGGVVLSYLITKHGVAIKQKLEAKLGSSITCMDKYRSMCLASSGERDERIRDLIKAIDEGQVLYPPD